MEEIIINMNTGEDGRDKVITPLISGWLDNIVIDSEEGVSFNIAIKGHEDDPIFKIGMVQGFEIILLRKGTVDKFAQAYGVGDKIGIHDKLVISVAGPLHKSLTVKLRYAK